MKSGNYLDREIKAARKDTVKAPTTVRTYHVYRTNSTILQISQSYGRHEKVRLACWIDNTNSRKIIPQKKEKINKKYANKYIMEWIFTNKNNFKKI